MESPCKNCITLSICKAEVHNGDLFNLVGLTDKCVHMKYLIFPHKKPLVTAVQRVDDPNQHLDLCIKALKEDLLKDICFDGNFSFDTAEPVYEGYNPHA